MRKTFVLGMCFGLLIGYSKGCTTMAYVPAPVDFPALKVVEHALPHVEFKDKCAPAIRAGHHVATGAAALLMGATLPFAAIALAVGPTLEACAEMHFRAGECHVYYSADYPPGATILKHEREGRCRGHDNPGDSVIRDAWAAYKLHARDAGLWADFNEQRKTRGW